MCPKWLNMTPKNAYFGLDTVCMQRYPCQVAPELSITPVLSEPIEKKEL
jgi:hypothetical protein